ncbi:hypothetical protein FB451DRAFT_1339494 [Mycena latifolia]|nr:hypothetical protein FB451DRAFT_1339494 [Mycena latifolia]
MHTAHIVAHPPDGVLFPGDNHAQNTFFAAPARRRPPRFRGLVWVVADDDLAPAAPRAAPAPAAFSSEDEEDEEDDFSDDEDEEEDELLPMDVDPDVRIVRGESDPSGERDLPPIATLDEGDAAKHMHPVHHRAGAVAIQTVGLPLGTPSAGSSSTDGSFFTMSAGTDCAHGDVSASSLPDPPASHSSNSSSSGSSYSSSPPVPAPANGHAEIVIDAAPLDHATGDAEGKTHEAKNEHESEKGNESKEETKVESKEDARDREGREESGEEGEEGRAQLLTCTFRPRELLRRVGGVGGVGEEEDGEWEFRPARVPDGISLRNFGIQVPIYATLSDIVVYSPKGLSSPALHALARRFAGAVRRKRAERCGVLGIDPTSDAPDAPLAYNVFVLDADAAALRATVPELMMRVFEGGERRAGRAEGCDGTPTGMGMEIDPPVAAAADTAPNTVDFGQRERDEMRELTRASEILSVFGGGARYPFASAGAAEEDERGREELATTTTASHWRPAVGQVFLGNSGDVPLGAAGASEDPFDFEATNAPAEGMGYDVCVECHEMAPFPALAHLRAAEDHLAMLDAMWDERGGAPPVRPPPNANAVIHLPFPSAPTNTAQTMNCAAARHCVPRALPAPAPRTRSLTSPAPSPAPALPSRTRPLKVLIYSSDGYTESSPLALSLLMAVRRLSLPEAYLELQVAKRRSFFVYPGELGLLRRVEARIGGGEVFAPARLGRRMSGAHVGSTGSLGSASGAGVAASAAAAAAVTSASAGEVAAASPTPYARPSAKSVSFAPGALVSPPVTVPSQDGVTRSGRPRARTSPWLPSFGDHQSWFNDPRFDGSFPSRVLPFLYLGNLNHASNAYMLHALGITHVVSVGECALVPPPGHCTSPGETCTSATCRPNHNTNAHFIQGKGPGNQGSLWIEEREGRIKVLDIKGVCDDGIDTLEPQLEPICEWIEKARQEGGQVLVHCRVGVSRSATVTIAYVMKHLSLPLVDAYLIVRSRRLSVLIQPNMRLLYNLCGWEIKLAKERAGEDERRLRKELARTLTWPYLSKEVHALNEKYLH